MNRFTKSMIGKTYLYNGTQYTVRNVKNVEDDLYEVITDRRIIRVTISELRKDFLPVKEPTNGQSSTALVKILKKEGLIDLTEVLMENIEKVRKDPKYIPQAESINDSANTLIKLTMTKLKVIKAAKELS